MPNHKSAEKRVRQDERRHRRNQDVRVRMRTFVKKFRGALESGDSEQAGIRLRMAEREIRRAASKGVIPARRASRAIGRLTRAWNAQRSS